VQQHLPSESVLDLFQWELGEFPHEFPDFRVVRSQPTTPAEPWVYISTGAWSGEGDPRGGHEFVICSPVDEPLHVETLAAVARRQADRDVVDVVRGSVLELGEPWLDGASCEHFYLARPSSFVPEFEHATVGDVTVHFLQALPITAAEARFVHEHGAVSFEKVLAEAPIDFLDPRRTSIV
jgi:hypothetical protein